MYVYLTSLSIVNKVLISFNEFLGRLEIMIIFCVPNVFIARDIEDIWYISQGLHPREKYGTYPLLEGDQNLDSLRKLLLLHVAARSRGISYFLGLLEVEQPSLQGGFSSYIFV